MRSCQHRSAFANPTIYHRRTPPAGINMQVLRITSQHFNPPLSKHGRINKYTTPIIIRLENTLLSPQLRSPRPILALIHKPRKRTTPTRTRIEPQLPTPSNLQRLIAYFELAALAPVIPARAETEVGPASSDVLVDPAVACAVERSAVAQVCASGEY